MRTLLSMATCPNCGAPIAVEPGRRNLICVYCNASLVVERRADGVAIERISAQKSVSPADVERVKQLIVDGKNDEAVALYAQVAGVPQDQAALAVEGLYLQAYWKLTRHMPINAYGFLLYAALILLGAAPAVWAATQVEDSLAYLALVALGGLFALWQLVGFARHLSSTFTSSFGALGRGRVLRRAVVREVKARNGFLIVALFEVAPDDGGPAFVDQETLLVGLDSLHKLSPGNVVRVRFDGSRQRVFPTSPVAVLATTA